MLKCNQVMQQGSEQQSKSTSKSQKKNAVEGPVQSPAQKPHNMSQLQADIRLCDISDEVLFLKRMELFFKGCFACWKTF